MTRSVLILIVITAIASWFTWRRLRYFLHMAQLEGYKLRDFVPWLRKRLDGPVTERHHIGIALVLGAGWMNDLLGWLPPVWTTGAVVLAWSVIYLARLVQGAYHRQEKKPLAFTARLTRLLIASAIVTLVLPVLQLLPITGAEPHLLTYLTAWSLTELLIPAWVVAGSILTMPIERSVHAHFKRKARRKLARRADLTTIGITGSFGKTSTKHITAELLRQRFNVLATPESYNTPMGLCLVINEQLTPDHQILLLEMGARYPGDIDELCRLAPPDHGVVTAVGPAHLETLGSLDGIAREKSTLIEHLPEEGTAVLNGDDERVRSMSEKAPGPVWFVSTQQGDAHIQAYDIEYGPQGASFTVRDEKNNEYEFQTRLLGRHNIKNILFAVALGRVLGLRLRELAHAVRRLEPIEHRLQLRRQNDITVIDDAFNANPTGAQNALEVLGQFDAGRKIIVTPGFIELGERQFDENYALGTWIADHADLAILIGSEQTKPIHQGLQDTEFPAENIKIFDSLFEAQNFLKDYLQPDDVVLYENDLPDQYTEQPT